jgi:hypothetical protein
LSDGETHRLPKRSIGTGANKIFGNAGGEANSIGNA